MKNNTPKFISPFNQFLADKGYKDWYVATRPLKKYHGQGKTNIHPKRFNALYAEFQKIEPGKVF